MKLALRGAGELGAGHVVALHLRACARSAPCRVQAVDALAGHGLGGDCHASVLSPRQVLIASRPSYQALGLPPMALRENVLVDFPIDGIVSGSRLRFSSGAEMVAMCRCEPCGRLDRHQRGLQSRIGAERGLLARVIDGGVLRPGDGVRVTEGSASPLWSDDWRERVRQVLKSVPHDR
jgi:MOSC domain-containing protein YiiM